MPSQRVLFRMSLALVLLLWSASARAGGITGVGFVSVPGGADAVAISPDGAHVYAAVDERDSLAIFTRDASTGLLTRVQTLNGVIGAQGVHDVRSIAVSPDGKNVYCTTRLPFSQGPQGVSVFARDAGTGFLTFMELQREGFGGVTGLYDPQSVVVSHDGENVYVRSRQHLASFSRSLTTGALTFMAAEAFDATNSVRDRGIALSADGAHLYVVGDGDTIRAYGRSPGTGALTHLSTVENLVDGMAGLNRPRALAVSPDGQHLYVVATGNPRLGNFNVTALARDAGTGALSYVARYHEARPLRGPNNLAVNAAGTRVYTLTSSFGDASVNFYQRDAGTGTLTQAGSVAHKDGVPAGTNLDAPLSIALSPDGVHVYVGDRGTDGIVVFEVRCGDGVVDPGEGCDDANNLSGDGCWTGCFVERCWACAAGSPSVCAPDDGTPCDDGTVCTTADTCTGGSCVGTPDDGVACNDFDVCTIDDTCGGGICQGSAEPEVACRVSTVPGGSTLSGQEMQAGNNKLDWKWGKGQATTVADFGDPAGGQTFYTACIYDGSAGSFRMRTDAYPGCTDDWCWKATSKGFKYRAFIHGVRMSLGAGPDGKAKIELRAKGIQSVLPYTPAVVVQLKSFHWTDDGPTVDACWGATFSSPTINDAAKFKASSD